MPKYFFVPIPQLFEIKKQRKTVYTTFYPHELTETPIFTIHTLCFLDAFLDFSFALSSPIKVSRGSNHVTLRSGTCLLSTVKPQKGRLPIATVSEGHDPKKSSFFLKVCGPWKLSKNDFWGFPPRQNAKDANLG